MCIDFSTRKSLYRSSLVQFIRTKNDLYLLTQMPGNIGDRLIWAGTEDLLDADGIAYKSLPTHEVGERNLLQSTLLIPGSGAFTRSYHEWLPELVLQASDCFKEVVILPSSFDPSVPIVAECLSRRNVLPFARETMSYRSIKSLWPAALSFDCAVYFRDFDEPPSLGEELDFKGNLLLALREDKDSLLPKHGLLPNPELNQDISVRAENLGDWLERINEYSTVITDRLHVAVACVLLNKALIYVDPNNRKISNYFQFTFRDTFNSRFKQSSILWLIENKFAIKR